MMNKVNPTEKENEASRDIDDHAVFFMELSHCVNDFLEEEESSADSVLGVVYNSRQMAFCQRFSERFANKPVMTQVLVLILTSHFQEQGPVAWHIPTKTHFSCRESLAQETGRLLHDGIAISLPEDRDYESRSERGVPLMLTLDVASYLFRDFDKYINFTPCFTAHGQWVKSKDIRSRKLFFAGDIRDDIMRLDKAISVERFDDVMTRLAERGFRKRLAIMLYGPPGTGKTELVWQLALRSGRDVIAADIAKMTGGYVGESERSYRSLFNSYKYAARIMKTVPIMLINEADCFLVNRMSVARSIDKFENNLQTIVLEELETFEGILFATTNYTQNMDSAFDRRFLLKLKIELPDSDARARIWQDVLPDLAEADINVIADSYRLTGAQIRNVAEQVVIREALDGGRVPFDVLTKMCREVELSVIGINQ